MPEGQQERISSHWIRNLWIEQFNDNDGCIIKPNDDFVFDDGASIMLFKSRN